MSVPKRQGNQPCAVEITDILKTTESTITVMLKQTGKAAVIRRDLAEIYGCRMFLPYWLAHKILNTSTSAQ